MIDKEELLERIEDALTTRMVKELFKKIVEECNDIPIPKKKENWNDDLYEDWMMFHSNDYIDGWNACLEEIEG